MELLHIIILPRDRVNGYNTYQMQEALRGSSSLQELHDKLYYRYNNQSKQYLQELIDCLSQQLKTQEIMRRFIVILTFSAFA